MGDHSHEEDPAPPPLSAEDSEFRRTFEQLVDWYRVKQSRALWSAFWPGALVLMPLGSVLTALSMFNRAGLAWAQPWLVACGILLTAGGPLWAMARLLKSIQRDDLYVAIRTDGLSIRLDPAQAERIYPWERIQEVEFDAARDLIRVQLDAGETATIRARFGELDLATLAHRIRDARRLAVWNNLRADRLRDAHSRY